MEFVRRSLNTLNSKFDAFVERQEKLELRVTAVEVRVTSHEKAVEGVVESIVFTAEKVNNVWHSLETLQKALAEATREIADSHIAMAKLSETVSQQERHSRAFNIRVLGVREENGENCINLLERVISERFDIPVGTSIENAHRTGKPTPDRPRHIIARFYSCPCQRYEIGPGQASDDPLSLHRRSISGRPERETACASVHGRAVSPA